MDLDSKIFGKKTFSSLLEDIYKNSKDKETKINELIQDLKPLVKGTGDATIIVPLIKGYLEQAIKNDDHLIKMAAIVQRALSVSTDNPEGALTEKERQELLDLVVNEEN